MTNITEITNQPLTPIFTPAEALARFKWAVENGRLKQGKWHSTDTEGRWFVCALSILGPDVNSASKCPTSIMPAWIASLVPLFFDTLPFGAAISWGLDLYTELARLDGNMADESLERWKELTAKTLKVKAKANAYANANAYAKAQAQAKANAYANANAYAKAKMAQILISILREQPIPESTAS